MADPVKNPVTSEAPPSKVVTVFGKIVDAIRSGAWKFFGALFMEDKGGVQAVSMTKVLALVTYGACMWLWMGITDGEIAPEVQTTLAAAKIDVPRVLKGAAEVPESMLYTLWALLGISGTAKVAGIFKGNSNGTSEPTA
jgi:hypothetical protein